MNKADLDQLVQETFPDYPSIFWTAVDTPIYIHTETDQASKQDYVIFEFMDRQVVWLNYEVGGGRSANVLVPFHPGGDSNVRSISKRFLSFLASRSDFPFTEIANMSRRKGEGILGQPIYRVGRTARHVSVFQKSPSPKTFTDNYWKALAFNREGLNSHSPYHQYLSYWKILELAFDRTEKDMKAYMSNMLERTPDLARQWERSLDDSRINKMGLLFDLRNRCAHVLGTSSRRTHPIEDPDDPQVFSSVGTAMVVVKHATNILIQDPTAFK
jgi:hypothetical protein